VNILPKDTSVDSPWLVPFDGKFEVATAKSEPPADVAKKSELRERLEGIREELGELQRMMFAHDRYSLLAVFQAMDAAGKDSTIRKVFTGINPAGCQVHSFKRPSLQELDHDFLWRTAKELPERGRIGVFNRSYYEDVLIVRVHPEILATKQLPKEFSSDGNLWDGRYQSIRDHEAHLARNGTVVVKFWLNVSLDEQAKRFKKRLEEPEKNWKFSEHDVHERKFWDKYMEAYQEAMNATSRPWAPWYAIPADDKAFMQLRVAEILLETMKGLPLRYPETAPERRAELERMKDLL